MSNYVTLIWLAGLHIFYGSLEIRNTCHRDFWLKASLYSNVDSIDLIKIYFTKNDSINYIRQKIDKSKIIWNKTFFGEKKSFIKHKALLLVAKSKLSLCSGTVALGNWTWSKNPYPYSQNGSGIKFCEVFTFTFNPFQYRVVFHIETSHLFCYAKQTILYEMPHQTEIG